mgnify:CR=1 FL=1
MAEESTTVSLPSMGEGVHEATIVKWLKQVGEKIEKDEPLVEVSTDKVDTEIMSPGSGYLLSILIKAGETVEVDQVIAFLSKNPDDPVPSLDTLLQKEPPASSHSPRDAYEREELVQNQNMAELSPGTFVGPVRSSPLVRKIARENSLNLHQIQGTGLYGRVTKKDVVAYINTGGLGSFSGKQALPGNPMEASPLKTERKNGLEFLEGVAVKRKKMSKIRMLTAEHMLRSVRTSPHVTTTFEIDLWHVQQFKNSIANEFLSERGDKLTYTAFFIEATIAALLKFPELNASVDGSDILFKEEINIGCAVAIESGLIVPVMKNMAESSLGDIAEKLQDLVSRARDKKLQNHEVHGGTFSITNPGMYGSIHSQPIINQPQVAILSVGAIVQRPVAISNQVEVRPLCQIGLTFDHRLVDGEGGALFLREMKQYLESYQS